MGHRCSQIRAKTELPLSSSVSICAPSVAQSSSFCKDDTGMAEIDESKRFSCLEVWGGNRFVSTSVEVPGMHAWIYSHPVDGPESIGGGDVHYVSSCAGGALT